MNYDYPQTPFAKAVLTGLFAGLAATLACLAYGFFYRLSTGFTMSAIINVPSIIMGCHIILVVCGMLYYAARKNFGQAGKIIFILVFLLLTAFCLYKTAGVQRSPIHELSVQFRGLLDGILVIIGLSISLLIPFLTGNRKFEEAVL
jgi:hypothetical protein